QVASQTGNVLDGDPDIEVGPQVGDQVLADQVVVGRSPERVERESGALDCGHGQYHDSSRRDEHCAEFRVDCGNSSTVESKSNYMTVIDDHEPLLDVVGGTFIFSRPRGFDQ